MNNRHLAILNLYPNVVSVFEGKGAFDANGNLVTVDDAAVNVEVKRLQVKENRAKAYPPMQDYLDGIVKGDQAQIDEYIAKCLDVKETYPKP